MRVAFVSKNMDALPSIEAVFLSHGVIVADNPELVVVVGGDGTVLRAERLYPGVPKALIKDSKVGNLFMEDTAEELAQAIITKRFGVEEKICLEACVHGRTYRAANDVIIRNKRLTQAIRFTVTVNGELLNGEMIGDGVVISTPLGSSAYYRTITHQTFDKGIGIAFNNIHNKGPMGPHVTESCDIVVKISRGPADLGVDNAEHVQELAEGDEVRICRSLIPLRLVRLR